tara:strand:+ start:399 stop:569 length:171 start_codon:yes stop_codon:yes gene_type:complete
MVDTIKKKLIGVRDPAIKSGEKATWCTEGCGEYGLKFNEFGYGTCPHCGRWYQLEQ